MQKKWNFWDIVILVLEIASPVISVIIVFLTPEAKEFDAELRLAIISAGISIPIVLLQISVTQGQNKIEGDVHELEIKIDEISEKLNHINPVLEEVFISSNERVKRFAFRRFDETSKVIQSAVNNNNSGNLRPNEYYEELLYLADLIINDKISNKKKFSGEVWAMTSFAEDEWIADEGYEHLWTEKLKEMVEKHHIKTLRLCLIPDSVYDIITKSDFTSPTKDFYSFWGFIELLKSYFGNNVSEHYLIREHDNLRFKEIGGFFAIKLTNGDLHILYGETVNSNGALTAKVLFDSNEIHEIRRVFERYINPKNKLETKLKEMVKSEALISFLRNLGIML